MLNMLNQHAFICERRRSRNLAPLSFPLNIMEPVQTLVGIYEELLRTTRFTLYMSVVSYVTYPLCNVYPTIEPKEAFANQPYRGKVVLESSLVSLVALDRKQPSPTQRPVQM